MTIFLVGLAALVAAVVGIFAGAAVNFRNFGSSGPGIIGSVAAFVVTITLAATTTGALSVVGVVLTALLAGIFIRGAGR